MTNRISASDMFWPLAFLLSLSVAIWQMPGLLAFLQGTSEVPRPAAAIPGALALSVLLVALVAGTKTVRPLFGEVEPGNTFDRVSLFISRPSWLLVVLLVCVMSYEVLMRYAFVSPTIWANEMTVWLAATIFLLAGPYVHQQRAHISVLLVHQVMPRWLRRTCDVLSALLFLLFAIALIWGGFNEASNVFVTWESSGTNFDPPLPATLKPLVLVMVALTALQGMVNLATDWNWDRENEPIDADEIDQIRSSIPRHGRTGEKQR